MFFLDELFVQDVDLYSIILSSDGNQKMASNGKTRPELDTLTSISILMMKDGIIQMYYILFYIIFKILLFLK